MKEDELQELIVDWLNHSLPMGSVFHHSPNEGKRHVAYKLKLKRQGTRFGWPDLEIFVPDTGWKNIEAKGAIMIELKRPKGGTVSANQKDIHERLRCTGVYCFVARKLYHVERYLEPLLKLRNNAAAEAVKRKCEALGG